MNKIYLNEQLYYRIFGIVNIMESELRRIIFGVGVWMDAVKDDFDLEEIFYE